MERSEQIGDLATALAKAQGEMKPAKKSGHNKHFGADFATLEDVWEAARGPLTKYGLSIVQLPGTEDGKSGLRTMILHASGQWMSDFFPFPVNVKQDPQGLGAACSYFRRYGVSAAVGIVTEDDDAERAMEQRAPELQKPPPRPQKPPATPPAPEGKAGDATQKQIAAIYALGGKMGWDDDGVHDVVKRRFPEITSMKQLTNLQASTLIKQIQETLNGVET